MNFEVGQLVTVWVDDLDPIHRKRWKGKYGLIEELMFTEQSNRDGKPSFIKVFFPGLQAYNNVEFIPERIRLVEDEKLTAELISKKEHERFLQNEQDFLNSLGSD
tara:strand:- start:1019 stop:1333 length:315 start_codon:yes stop_codon:yes gene_type:complete